MSFSNSIATSLLKQPIICTIVLILSFSIIEAQLSSDHYSYSCPNALDIVNEVVVEAIKNETRLGASLLRLHFHDCFVNGCDGSVLLDDNGTFTGEKTALPNNHSLRGFHVIDVIKAKLESACPNVVSCADILAIVARDAVYNLGGPSWEVQLGRRDSVTANQTEANLVIPAPFSNLSVLISNFAAVGLSLEDLVALSGAHTIGFARCNVFRQRIYGDVDINPTFADSLRKICPRNGSDNVLQGLDAKTPSHFDNLYYKNLLIKKGLLHSDQELYSGNEADPIVRTFSRDVSKFFDSFAKAMIKMGDISPLTGSNGEIRRHCRRSNKKP